MPGFALPPTRIGKLRAPEPGRGDERVVLAVEVDRVLAQEAVHDLELLGEARNSFARGAELEAVRLVLSLHPAGAEPERDAPAGDLVGRRRGAGKHGGVPERRR